MKTLVLCFLVLIIRISGMAQDRTDLREFFSFGINAGMFGWAPADVGRISGNAPVPGRRINNVLAPKMDNSGGIRYVPAVNTSLGLHAAYFIKTRTKDLLSFQFEIQRNRASCRFIMPVEARRNGASLSSWVESGTYLDYLTSVQYNWLHNLREHKIYDEYNYLRISTGAAFLRRSNGVKVRTNSVEDWTENGRGLKTHVVSDNPASFMIAAEIGKKIVNYQRNTSLDLGLVLYYPLSHSFAKEYEFFSNGVSIGKSEITYKGSAIMLNARYAFNLQRGRARMADTLPKAPREPAFEIHSVNGRRVEVQKVTTFEKDSMDIFIWDKNERDGDKVALYFNDQLILTDYELLGMPKKISVQLAKGANYLVVHAIDQGTTPPVTAAVRISEREISRSTLLISDEKESGAWKIIYKPRKK